MTCSVDNYYKTEIASTAGNACGSCYCDDEKSCAIQGPADCPDGQYWSGNYTQCGSCKFSLLRVDGYKKKCLRHQPGMNTRSKLNCCLDQNLPNNSPNGYCASGWCPGSDNCISFLTSYCQGDNLKKDECKQFCRTNPGKCDHALLSYCSNPNNFTAGICGCALPPDQYLLSQLKTPEGLSVPISCDQRCGVNTDAIRLQGQQDCEIGAICVTEISDVNIIENEIGNNPNIVVTQDCGAGPSGPPFPQPPIPSGGIINRIEKFASTTAGKILITLIVISIILILILSIWSIFGK